MMIRNDCGLVVPTELVPGYSELGWRVIDAGRCEAAHIAPPFLSCDVCVNRVPVVLHMGAQNARPETSGTRA